jgi:hypothetical protein
MIMLDDGFIYVIGNIKHLKVPFVLYKGTNFDCFVTWFTRKVALLFE